MQVSVEQPSPLVRKLTVSVPAEQLESQVSQRLRDLARTVRLKGFRPGKVPAKVIEQRFGAQVRGEAVSEVIRESFNEALRKENLRPVLPPSIETTGVPSDGEFRYVATFEVMPQVPRIDVSGLKVKRPTASVEESDVDQMIETLRMQRRQWVPVERPAQAKDMVLFESHVVVDGTRYPAEGEERSGTVIGSGAVFEQIETRLEGLSAGDTTEFEIQFPENHQLDALKGKAGTMHLKVIRVSEARLPELDEAFMASFGITEGGLETFRKEVRANLERELKGALMHRLKLDVVKKLLELHPDLELPAGLVDAELQALVAQAREQAKQRGQKDVQIEPESLRPMARQRVAAAVLLGELARQNQIRLDQDRLNEMLATIASTYEDPMQVIELYRNDPQLMRGLESRVIEDQVIDWIADHSDLTVEQLTFAEVMRPAGAA
ncbi:MAG: trigger factor [Lysobacteraceae bacterium]|nr:MAG: trigger factor [Xanthomonadaceae bacterium]